MDGRVNKSDGDSGQGGYIWLRYAMQFTSAGRTHTIEMGIPMPIGASAETREQLLREAEAGMNQLSGHIENRVAQVLQRAQSSQGSANTPSPATKSSPPSRPAARPASMPAPQTVAQPMPSNIGREMTSGEHNAAGETIVPPTRPNIGASMPLTPVSKSDPSGNIPLPEFLQYIKENLGIDAKQAMSLLKVKTLTEINRREALERLMRIMSQENAATSRPAASSTETRSNAQPPDSAANSHPATSPSQRDQTSSSLRLVGREQGPANEPEHTNAETARENPAVYIFDEEVEPDEEEELDDLDDLDQSSSSSRRDLTQAEDILTRLREARGATTASPARLQVLHNVAGSQLSSEQLHDLVSGVWGVTTLKKLKVDQVEALISWAKEDDFVSEAEDVLELLEEERYARGNR